MWIHPRQSILLACLAIASLTVAGCNVERAAQLVDKSDSTELSKPNTAIGGVNLVQQTAGKTQNWDRHIAACLLDSTGALVLGTHSSDSTLTIVSDGDDAHAVLNGPTGVLRFAKKDCAVYKLEFGSSQITTSRTGSETLVCTAGSATLNTTVRFHNCTR